MQQVPSIPDWVLRDFWSFVSALRYVVTKGRDKALILQANAVDKFKQFSSDFEVVEWLSVEGLFYVTLLVVIISSMLIISLNVYRKIRYAIPARVNCWFCNTNTKVLYTLKDTWTCPNCHQYNGFTADGHYNKRLPAQFIEALNRPVRGGPAKGYQPSKCASNTNGLCSQCNLNQVLKVFQLASFVPVNERNYDVEIEAEQKRLEQLYDICSQCKTIVEMALKRKPAVNREEVATVKTKVQINRVTPTPTTLSDPRRRNKFNNDSGGLSMLHDDCFKDVSESSDNSGDSFLSLDNLKIGSKTKNRNFADFHTPLSSPSPKSISPSSPQPCSSLMYDRHPSMYGSPTQLDHTSTPLWKDYPFVQGRSSPTYSVTDTMSCPVGRPAYVAYNAVSSSPSQFSYQSSNIGGVFGGRKPLISPPKFSNNNAPVFSPFIRYGAYYDISATPVPVTVGHNHNPIMFNPHYFTNPISRSSSQSSGFVSQHGGGPMSPQSQEQTPNGFCPGT